MASGAGKTRGLTKIFETLENIAKVLNVNVCGTGMYS